MSASRVFSVLAEVETIYERLNDLEGIVTDALAERDDLYRQLGAYAWFLGIDLRPGGAS